MTRPNSCRRPGPAVGGDEGLRVVAGLLSHADMVTKVETIIAFETPATFHKCQIRHFLRSLYRKPDRLTK